jgi:hypothetical protein
MGMEKYSLSRENHLNHMTKVVPFIFFIYGLQSYFLLSFSGRHLGSTLMWLGVTLSFLISSLICYDMTHKLKVNDDDSFEVGFSWLSMRKFQLNEIKDVKIISDQEKFASIVIELRSERKIHVFFVDDAEKIKKLLLPKINVNQDIAA